MHIPVFGNGDVVDPVSAKHFKDTYGVDGLMVARAVYGNPWIFKEIKHYLKTGELIPPPHLQERIRIARIQLHKSCEWKGERRGVIELRKHWADYFKGYPHFKPFRQKMMELESLDEVNLLLNEIEEFYV
jgi:tRNA-dihydrouridine synthase